MPAPSQAPPKVAFYNDPHIRGYLFQALTFVIVAIIFYFMYVNAKINFGEKPIFEGFSFLENTAGFNISQKLIPYNETMSFGRAFVIGILNTLLIAVIGIVLATFLGFSIGIARLSKNYVVQKIAYWYIEIIRNLPLLFQLIFWYLILIAILPNPKNSISPFDGIYLNQRGLYIPSPELGPNFVFVFLAFILGLVATFFWRRKATQKQAATGQITPVFLPSLLITFCLPLLVFFVLGRPATLDIPELAGFNIKGGVSVVPEFVALLVALVTYTGGFIAEIVRSGIQSVNYGQTEAGKALGLKDSKIISLIVIPQAMRVIIPPLTSQYLNLTKNSSLATAIGYPDMVAVGQTILNQSSRSLEVISLWMLVYMSISLTTSLIMNWYNSKNKLVER